MATARQKINLSTKWSAGSLERNYGAHHRFTLGQFVKQNFLVPIDLLGHNKIGEFAFSEEITLIENGTVLDAQGFYRPPMNVSKFVSIPERFRPIL